MLSVSEKEAKVLLVDPKDLRICNFLLVIFELLEVRRPVILQQVYIPQAIRLDSTLRHTYLYSIIYKYINDLWL